MSADLRRLVLVAFAAPLIAAAEVRPITIGIIVPHNEPNAASVCRGAELAIAEANAPGQPPVRLETRTQDGQWGSAGNEAVALACDRHADAIIAPSDGAATHLILQVSGRTRVPVATLCADCSVTEAGIPWAVRVVPRTDQQAEALFATIRRADGSPFRWWAVVPGDRSGRPVLRDLQAAARHTKTPLNGSSEVRDLETEMRALVRQITAGTPDGVLLWLPPAQAGRIVAALRTSGYAGRLAGPSAADSPEFMAAAGPAAAGFVVAAFQPNPSAEDNADQFNRTYRQKYHADPDFSAAAGYDAVRVLVERLRQNPGNPGYRQFPIATPTDGATGRIHFDALGNRTDSLHVLACARGRFMPASFNDTCL